MFTGRKRRLIAMVSALAVAGCLLPSSGGVVATARTSAFLSAGEAKKIDAIATPKLNWYTCYQTAECTTVRVPRDYDKPKGAKVELALLRVKARNQKKRIGSLFINPGGPGGSATQVAYFSPQLLSADLLDRFDIVGMDPRGVAFSDNVRCLPGAREQESVLAGYNTFFPITSQQERAWLKSDRSEGQACSKDSLAKSMSTAEVARDMELMRRAVGDSKLTYLGFSYGSYLGQVYANMFPDRFRAVAVDGVLDPVAWAGDKSNQGQPLEQRLRASSGAWKALRELLVRCDQAGGEQCSFAPGDPVANLAVIADRLKRDPLQQVDDFSGEVYTFGYQDLVANLLFMLYDPAGFSYIIGMLTDLWIITEPPADASAQSARKKQALESFNELRRRNEDLVGRPHFGFPYDNSFDAFASVTCTDSRETTRGRDYPAFAAKADRRAPYFGRVWTWSSSVCAGDAFTGDDEDAYTGPFNTKTAKPVLVVGNYFDPATNYAGAVSAAKRLPNSRLLSSNSWGHTAYGTSDCVISAVDSYLLKGTVPAAGKVCKGDLQPFQSIEEEALVANAARQEAFTKSLPRLARR